ncbi:MAG TPA: ferredoxin [Myxococcota bacterium]|nr:ferredoxin [Myxococcales bacterium]HPG26182.1 ferredoxin [Myxococcota bacterium]
MKVHVDLDLCQGHARCESICPEVFATDAVEGKCVLRETVVPPAVEENARLAVRNCPEGALSTSED